MGVTIDNPTAHPEQSGSGEQQLPTHGNRFNPEPEGERPAPKKVTGTDPYAPGGYPVNE